MPSANIYRIYPEQKNKRKILRLAAERFESFTVQPTTGYYRGKHEKSVVLELIGVPLCEVKALAVGIKKMNGQKSILEITARAQATVMRMRNAR